VELEELTLTEAVKAAAGYPPRRPAGRATPSLTQSVKEVASRTRKPPATRVGRKGIVIYVEPEMGAAIRRLAGDLNTSVQKLGEMAFDLLFEKFEEPSPG
jgi:hypothetical protein